MKAFIITIEDDPYSTSCANRCLNSIRKHGCEDLKPGVFHAITPDTTKEAMMEVFGKELEYTYPRRGEIKKIQVWGEWDVMKLTGRPVGPDYPPIEDRLNVEDMHLTGYSTDYIDTIVATAMSHAALWKFCVQENEPFIIIEHDAIFVRDFSPKEIANHIGLSPMVGACSINDPRGATRRSQQYHAAMSPGVNPVPNVDEGAIGSIPPQGLPGNSAYLITPSFAKRLLDVMSYNGIWPNDAFMCRQLFPGMLYSLYPYATVVKQTRSTSQGR